MERFRLFLEDWAIPLMVIGFLLLCLVLAVCVAYDACMAALSMSDITDMCAGYLASHG